LKAAPTLFFNAIEQRKKIKTHYEKTMIILPFNKRVICYVLRIETIIFRSFPIIYHEKRHIQNLAKT